MIVYVSKSVQDLAAVLLHTSLSRLGFSRYHCFLIEYGLSEFQADSRTSGRLPERFEQDLQLLSSTDLILQLQHIQYSTWYRQCPMLTAIRKRCEELLIEVPTYNQIKKLSNMDYISGSTNDEQLV